MKITDMQKPKLKLEPALLTHPNIPKPLHHVNPRTVLGKEWWDEQRQKAYKANNYCCYACGIHKSKAKYHHWLEAHEDYDIDYEKGEVKLNRIVALCHSCHNFIHSGRLKMLADKGEISDDKYCDIMKHGRKVLKSAGLNQWAGHFGKTADWGKWRLVINGEKYPPKFKSLNEWREYFA